MKQMWQDIFSFDLSALTFIRPQALWLFIILFIWSFIHLLSLKQKNNWQKHIALVLQPFVITNGSVWRNQLPFLSFFLALVFGIIALAGPSWKKIDLPESKVSARMYIGLSLSPTMLREDLQPNRIERAKLKIGSLLKANPGVATGIFVYSGTPHLLLPPTTDYVLINQQLENLHPEMMPVRGNNTGLLFQLVDSTLKKIEAPSTFLWIMDEISEEDVNRLIDFTSNSPHKVEMVPVISANGAINPGTNKRSQLDQSLMSGISSIKNITLNKLTLDDSDMEAIAKRVSATRDFYLDAEDDSEQQQDMGLIFIWPMLILIALSFRKGAVIYSLLIFTMVGSSCSYNQAGADFWYSKDKIGYEYYKAGEYEKALEYLEDPAYRSLAYYQLGDYMAAAELSRSDSSASGKYNLGLSLFNLGLYEEAAKAFDEAGQLNPQLKIANDAAQLATKYAEENTFTAVQKELKKKIEGYEIVEDIGKSEELSAEEFGKKEDEDDPNKDKNQQQMQGEKRTAQEADKPDLQDEVADQMDSKDVLLKKTVVDPSDFLRKRFAMQKDIFYPNVK